MKINSSSEPFGNDLHNPDELHFHPPNDSETIFITPMNFISPSERFGIDLHNPDELRFILRTIRN
ncbi:hypothetical protein [Robertmurraya korlensis]|uniref:hypothetical protein n=1 Tax=Robertmurraya korlensis TaxID=519977 RepID=UPI000824FC0D|nr:hypothetical protein [Robertmurraya korlensis]